MQTSCFNSFRRRQTTNINTSMQPQAPSFYPPPLHHGPRIHSLHRQPRHLLLNHTIQPLHLPLRFPLPLPPPGIQSAEPPPSPPPTPPQPSKPPAPLSRPPLMSLTLIHHITPPPTPHSTLTPPSQIIIPPPPLPNLPSLQPLRQHPRLPRSHPPPYLLQPFQSPPFRLIRRNIDCTQ